MSVQVEVNPELLRWARERVFPHTDDLAKALGGQKNRERQLELIEAWERTGSLSLPQLEKLASKTYTPVGFLFLPTPPEEKLPIPDFRTADNTQIDKPSPNLLDTIYECQSRQDWFREFLIGERADRLSFVGSVSTDASPEAVARSIRERIGLTTVSRAAAPSWEEALRLMVERIEEAGILVMRNGVVGNNTHRKLKVTEFRGFCLSDEFAPLVFVNASDAKAAQMFTLAHELAHLWLGQSGVSNFNLHTSQVTERFCNATAAEVLIPLAEFRTQWRPGAEVEAEVARLARVFKVSGLVVLIRAREAGLLSQAAFDQYFQAAQNRIREVGGGSGGDFYRTQGSRLGKRFARAVISSALEGTTLYREAFQLLGVKKSETFTSLARSLGVA